MPDSEIPGAILAGLLKTRGDKKYVFFAHIQVISLTIDRICQDYDCWWKKIRIGVHGGLLPVRVEMRDGKSGWKAVSRKLRLRTARNSVRYCSTSSWNSESSGLGRRGEQKGGNKGRVLTFVANSWFVRKLSEGAKSRHNLKRLKLVFFLSLVWQCRNCRCKSALRQTLLR